jgi:hypothetical protein
VLEGEQRYARFGQPVLPAVRARTFLSHCLGRDRGVCRREGYRGGGLAHC